MASLDRAARIEEATTKAIDLIRNYIERDPRDGTAENPWQNPQSMLEELDRARDLVVAAWKEEAEETKRAENGEEDAEGEVDNNEDFRAAYMDMITNAFADVLEDMRANNSEELDVDILVDCLQSGMDILTMEEKELFMGGDDEELEDDSGVTPHEQRRVQLGLHVSC
jgi:hypothetical protein